jgi:hypothetical protein
MSSNRQRGNAPCYSNEMGTLESFSSAMASTTRKVSPDFRYSGVSATLRSRYDAPQARYCVLLHPPLRCASPPTIMIDAATLLPWSEPSPVATGRGPVPVRKAPATPEFWALWNSERKEELKASGIHLSAFHCDGTYEVFLWPAIPDPAPAPPAAIVVAPAPYVRPEGLLSVTDDDTEFIRKCFIDRQTMITCSGSQCLALMSRKESVRVNGMRVGKTPGIWICTVTYLDPELL